MTRDIPQPHRRVLVVDDNHDGAAMLAALLRNHGHAVEEAHDGASALQIAEAFLPEIVFLDLAMPGMDGFAVAEALREQERMTTARTLVIALSAFGHAAFREATAEGGFDGHLQKPYAADELLALVATLYTGAVPVSIARPSSRLAQ